MYCAKTAYSKTEDQNYFVIHNDTWNKVTDELSKEIDKAIEAGEYVAEIDISLTSDEVSFICKRLQEEYKYLINYSNGSLRASWGHFVYDDLKKL